MLQTPQPGSNLYAPAHDVFEDWALISWLDQLFEQHSRRLAPVLAALGTHPALRRAYRRWLTESLDADHHVTDSLVLEIVKDAAVEPHWREDTLVSILLSAGVSAFLLRNVALLIADDAKLLRTVRSSSADRLQGCSSASAVRAELRRGIFSPERATGGLARGS